MRDYERLLSIAREWKRARKMREGSTHPAISSTAVSLETMAFFFARALAPRAMVTERTVGMAMGKPPTTSTSMLFKGAQAAFIKPGRREGREQREVDRQKNKGKKRNETNLCMACCGWRTG